MLYTYRLYQAKRDSTHTDCTRQNGTVHIQTVPGKTGQYTYRLYLAKRDSTPNEPVPSREILVIYTTTKIESFKLKIFYKSDL